MEGTLLVVAMVAIAALSLWLWARRARRRSVAATVRPEAMSAAVGLSALCADGKAVAARVEQQLELLDALILEADREIERLQTLLADARAAGGRDLTRDEQQRCFALWESGRTAEDIARRLHVGPEQVRQALDEWRRPRHRAA